MRAKPTEIDFESRPTSVLPHDGSPDEPKYDAWLVLCLAFARLGPDGQTCPKLSQNV